MNRKMLIIFYALILGFTDAAPAAKADATLVAPLAPLVAAAPAALVTATSSQVVARNYNGLVAPLAAAPTVVSPAVPAPLAAPVVAPYVAAPFAAYPYAAPYYTYY